MNLTTANRQRQININWGRNGRFILPLALILLTILLGTPPQPQLTNVQPALLVMAAEQPETAVRVIIQGSATATNLEEVISRLGGRVIRDLYIIDAIVAEMEAETAVDLAQDVNVNWVSLDTQFNTAVANNTLSVRDDFDTNAFNNNDGSSTWLTDWVEIGENDGSSIGDLRIRSNRMFIREAYRGIERSVDLSGAVTAVLSFDYRRYSFDKETDYVTLEISSDQGASWTQLDRFSGPANEDDLHPTSYDIALYASKYVTIRFVTSSTFSDKDQFYVDNFQVEYMLSTIESEPEPIYLETPASPTLNTYLTTTNVQPLWEKELQGQGVTVAVIDSGVSQSKDFGDRLVAQVNFSENAKSLNDSYGHGTHVAGIIGGNGTNSDGIYQGIAPQVNLIGLKVSDEQGMAYESDTVAAMQWVLENKDEYNIRVVNLSLNSTVKQSYHTSPFDLASELLWFNGVVVVASAGNRSLDGNFYTITASPANDPFIITVGASTEEGTDIIKDDTIALFSAHGTTVDGFAKPDIIAPGFNIVSVLSSDSKWMEEYPERLEGNGNYFRLSGTSMATPIVSGAAALLLQAEPDLTPDQVKYRLMDASNTITPIWIDAILDSRVYPYLDVYTAVSSPSTESANQGVMPHMSIAQMALIAYWANQDSGDSIDWSNVDWDAVVWDDVDWNSVDWAAVNWDEVDWDKIEWDKVDWGSVNWGSVNWGSVNWGSVNWGSVNWGSVNWGSVNWGSVSWNN